MLIKTVCILFSGLLTVFPRVFAPVEGSVNRTERPFRDEICLNGLWDFQPADLPQDYVRGGGVAPQLPLPSDNGWDDVKIRIPSPWNVNSFACNCLEFDVTVANDSDREAKVSLSGNVREWVDKSGTDILSAPEVEWELGAEALRIPPRTVKVGAGKSVTVILSIPVQEDMLKYWTPEHPDLYAASGQGLGAVEGHGPGTRSDQAVDII